MLHGKGAKHFKMHKLLVRMLVPFLVLKFKSYGIAQLA